MDSGKIKIILIVAVAIIAAIQLGIAAATAQFEVVAWVAGGTVLATCVALGRRVWLILPFMTTLGLVLPLPGNFSSDFIAQGIVCGFCTLLFLMRRLPVKFRFTELEMWCLLLLLFVAQAYLRNPVGLNIFGGETVGAKPYALFLATVVTAMILSVLLINPADLRWWVRLSLIGALCNFGLGALVRIFPPMGYFLGASFSADVSQQGFTNEVLEGRAGRASFVREISVTLSTWVASKVSPLKGAFHPFWAPLILFTMAAAAYSGFRSQIAAVGLIYFIGVCYRGGFKGVFVSVVLASLAVGMLSIVNLAVPLPDNIQRALAFLPGTWDESHKQDTESSTDWRMEMWIEVLTTDRYIKNKWIGDGLGLSVEELQRTRALLESSSAGALGTSGFDLQREAVMLVGDYHSGPIQTIRTIGYIGLLFLFLGMIRVAVHAHRQIRRSRGTEWHAVTLFLCIPLIVAPIYWALVFGDFLLGATHLLMGTALVRMLQNNLPLPVCQKQVWLPYTLEAKNRRNVDKSAEI